MLYQIIYTSAATTTLAEGDVLQISQSAGRNNHASGVTGMLLVFDDNILQVLEGEEDAVWETYRRISSDPRHVNPMILTAQSIEAREFPNWSMGFQQVDEKIASEFLFNLTGKSLSEALPARPSIEVESLTNAFSLVSRIQD